MAPIIDYEYGISAVDSGFGRPLLDAVHLIVEGGRAAVVDTATNACVPRVLDALRHKGLAPEDVDYVILTHVHLDHAGGAGLLMQHLPNARLAVHPRGARHMADPSRLWAGTVAVYGEAAARRMYGELVAVDPARIIETPHESVLRLGGRELVFLDTPGHARHHVCVLDGKSGHIFAGDTFGLSYRELDRDGRQFVFPTVTPVQFDPPALHRSVDLLLSHRPDAIYVTHFSQVRDVPRLGADLHRLIDAHAELGLRERNAGTERHERLVRGVQRILLDEAQRQGWRLSGQPLLELLRLDVELNAQGIASWLDA
ncbi:MAG: MBL fold metallo-hydrolase [Pseudomonadota bacterium]